MSDHPDNYISQGTQPLKLTFGKEGNYSDAFVRTETAPLMPKKSTRPLVMTPEVIQGKIEHGIEQLRTCQIIIDKFAQRMKILQWAINQLNAPTAPPPPPQPEPQPQPAPAPAAKKGLAAKKPLPKKPAKPLKGGKNEVPAAPPAKPINPNELSVAERQIGEMVKRNIAHNPGAKKRVQVALFQYNDAAQSIKEGHAVIEEVQKMSDIEQAWHHLEAFDSAKIQGKIYPLCNLHEVFKLDADISRLFPAPTQDLKTARPNQPPKQAAPAPQAPPPPQPKSKPEPPVDKNPLSRIKGIFGRK